MPLYKSETSSKNLSLYLKIRPTKLKIVEKQVLINLALIPIFQETIFKDFSEKNGSVSLGTFETTI